MGNLEQALAYAQRVLQLEESSGRGVSGATLLKDGDHPYFETPEFEAARKEALGQPVHLRVFFGDLHARFRVVHFQRLHVVAVGQTLEGIEAVHGRRPVVAGVAEVPFADQGGGVGRLQHLGDGQFGGRQA